MLSYQKVICSFLFALIWILFLSGKVFGQVVINEFSSNSDPEWVELYNTLDSPIDLTGWFIKDEVQNPKVLSGTITGHGYFVFENREGWLNNSGGDTITLLDNSLPSGQINQIIYGKSNSIVGTPAFDKSAGRSPDGSSNWVNQLDWTKLSANPIPQTPTPMPTDIPEPEDTPTPTATPTSAPTPIPKPTVTPTPKNTPTPSTSLRASPTRAIKAEESEIVLAAVTSLTPTDLPVITEKNSYNNLFPFLAIGTGTLLLAVSAVFGILKK